MPPEEIILLERKHRDKVDEMQKMNSDLVDKESGEVRGFTDEEKEKYEKLAQAAAAIREVLEREKNKNDYQYSGGGDSSLQEGGDDDSDSEYRDLGEQMRDIYEFRMHGREMRAGMEAGVGETGGFLIQKQFSESILEVDLEQAIVRPRATIIPAGDSPDAEYEIPALTQGSSITAGVVIYWTKEGGTVLVTDGKMRTIDLKSHEMTAYIPLTNKLLNNAPAAAALVTKHLRNDMIQKEEHALIKGDGVGKPKGVLQSTALVEVTRNTSTDFKFADVSAMLANSNLESLGNYLWVINQSVFPKLFGMADSVGNSIFIQGNVVKGIATTLGGVPVRFTGKTPVLGTKGDVMLLDFSNYIIKDGSGPFIDISKEVLFLNNKTAIKLTWNVDGQGWLDAPITLEDGTTQVSPFVALK